MIRLSWVAFAALALVIAGTAAAQACSCMPVSRQEIIAGSDLVVKGRVRAVNLVSKGRYNEVCATVRVQRTIKGPRRRVVTICTSDNSGLCGVSFTLGEVRTIAADWTDRTKRQARTGSCSSL